MGLRLVKVTVDAAARTDSSRLVGSNRSASVQDLAARAALDRGDLEALAAAGAFASLSGNRHLAFWEVAGTERACCRWKAACGRVGRGPDKPRKGATAPAPTEGERIVADYASVGLTLGRHPLALLREWLRKQLLSASELHALPMETGTHSRHRSDAAASANASGVTFLTLEDETGQVNIIVWERIGESSGAPLLESRLLEVQGELQRQDGVMHVVARRLIDRTALLGELLTRSRDFH